MNSDIDFYKVVFEDGNMVLDLPDHSRSALQQIDADVLASHVTKWEYLTCVCIADPTHNKAKEREIYGDGRFAWQQALATARVW